ncbi:hypothetical protein Ae201684_017764 [Aphanomyces euteiches]|uniref:Uncharacterized protein n=1 Tax=Aphanomyces euteiches TaxID=100861 RepID=A0A6G0W7P8_9STRA|nr:hypothetical protein Ae201684_017764 [Aphanomyces euteiches]
MSVDVVVGATFALDHVQSSLLLLFQHVLPSVTASFQWIPYGHLTSTLSSPRPFSTDYGCTVLFIRLLDLFHTHPELFNETPQLGPMERFLEALATHVKLNEKRHAVIFICPPPPEFLHDDWVRQEKTFLDRLPPSVHVFSNLFRDYSPPTPYYDPFADKTIHSPYTRSMNHLLTLLAARQVCRVFRRLKKVIVVDCDNTLWSGSVSEDGLDGIAITEEYRALQSFLALQYRQGVLLCICSKNNIKDVEAVFAHRSEMVLQWKTHFVLQRVNFKPKFENIREMVEEYLHLGLDSVVFIDDNPGECSQVAQQCPSVAVLQVPLAPQLSPAFLQTAWILDRPFGSEFITEEDANRTHLYKNQLLAIETPVKNQLLLSPEQSLTGSTAVQIDFDAVHCSTTPNAHLERLIQLCQRTNQFNCHTSNARACTVTDALFSFPGSIVYVHVTDRFGHYGLVGLLAWKTDEITGNIEIPVFLLSCRVLNRGIEHAMLEYVAKLAPSVIKTISIAFESTIRNVSARAFLSGLPNVITTPLGFQIELLDAVNLRHEPSLTTMTTTSTVQEISGELGLPIVHFQTLASLSAFLEAKISSASVIQVDEPAKFRRLQRESVKQTQDSSEPIWETNNVAERTLCPQCKLQTIAQNTKCTHGRCRSCCYYIQKWIQRLDHQHLKARENAKKLLEDAQVDLSVGISKQCLIHRNPRRVTD